MAWSWLRLKARLTGRGGDRLPIRVIACGKEFVVTVERATQVKSLRHAVLQVVFSNLIQPDTHSALFLDDKVLPEDMWVGSLPRDAVLHLHFSDEAPQGTVNDDNNCVLMLGSACSSGFNGPLGAAPCSKRASVSLPPMPFARLLTIKQQQQQPAHQDCVPVAIIPINPVQVSGGNDHYLGCGDHALPEASASLLSRTMFPGAEGKTAAVKVASAENQTKTNVASASPSPMPQQWSSHRRDVGTTETHYPPSARRSSFTDKWADQPALMRLMEEEGDHHVLINVVSVGEGSEGDIFANSSFVGISAASDDNGNGTTVRRLRVSRRYPVGTLRELFAVELSLRIYMGDTLIEDERTTFEALRVAPLQCFSFRTASSVVRSSRGRVGVSQDDKTSSSTVLPSPAPPPPPPPLSGCELPSRLAECSNTAATRDGKRATGVGQVRNATRVGSGYLLCRIKAGEDMKCGEKNGVKKKGDQGGGMNDNWCMEEEEHEEENRRDFSGPAGNAATSVGACDASSKDDGDVVVRQPLQRNSMFSHHPCRVDVNGIPPFALNGGNRGALPSPMGHTLRGYRFDEDAARSTGGEPILSTGCAVPFNLQSLRGEDGYCECDGLQRSSTAVPNASPSVEPILRSTQWCPSREVNGVRAPSSRTSSAVHMLLSAVGGKVKEALTRRPSATREQCKQKLRPAAGREGDTEEICVGGGSGNGCASLSAEEVTSPNFYPTSILSTGSLKKQHSCTFSLPPGSRSGRLHDRRHVSVDANAGAGMKVANATADGGKSLRITVVDPHDHDRYYYNVPVVPNCPVAILREWLLKRVGDNCRWSIHCGNSVVSEAEQLTFFQVTGGRNDCVFSFVPVNDARQPTSSPQI